MSNNHNVTYHNIDHSMNFDISILNTFDAQIFHLVTDSWNILYLTRYICCSTRQELDPFPWPNLHQCNFAFGRPESFHAALRKTNIKTHENILARRMQKTSWLSNDSQRHKTGNTEIWNLRPGNPKDNGSDAILEWRWDISFLPPTHLNTQQKHTGEKGQQQRHHSGKPLQTKCLAWRRIHEKNGTEPDWY